MADRVVILGAGQAGSQLAATLREKGHRGPITLVGDEPHLPYQRPPLSKGYLKGEVSPERLLLRPAQFYADRDIVVTTGEGARAIEPRAKQVVLAGGQRLAYDTLVVATGTRPRIPPLSGADLENVFALRRLSDVDVLRPWLAGCERIAIIGGGYIGLEVAAVLRRLGKSTTIVESEERVLKRVTSEPVSAFFAGLHRAHGVEILSGVRAAEIVGATRASGVALVGRGTVACDMVLIATGAVANGDLAADAGLAVSDGILVDAFGRTSAPDIYACGDCARFPSRRYGRSVRLESVQNAIEQAKCVAASICGEPVAYDPVPWFWSDQYDTKLQIAGLYDPGDEMALHGAPESGSFCVEYRRAGRLVAVDAIDNPRAHMLARRRIAEATATCTGENPGPAEDTGPAARVAAAHRRQVTTPEPTANP